jgi:hypothetical protein
MHIITSRETKANPGHFCPVMEQSVVDMCYNSSMTSEVVVSRMWESVSTDSNAFLGVDVGAYHSENLCRKPAV